VALSTSHFSSLFGGSGAQFPLMVQAGPGLELAFSSPPFNLLSFFQYLTLHLFIFMRDCFPLYIHSNRCWRCRVIVQGSGSASSGSYIGTNHPGNRTWFQALWRFRVSLPGSVTSGGHIMGFSGFHDLGLGHFCLNWLIMFLEIPSSLLWAFACGYSIGMVHLLFLGLMSVSCFSLLAGIGDIPLHCAHPF
jgi:hypothetical protein